MKLTLPSAIQQLKRRTNRPDDVGAFCLPAAILRCLMYGGMPSRNGGIDLE